MRIYLPEFTLKSAIVFFVTTSDIWYSSMRRKYPPSLQTPKESCLYNNKQKYNSHIDLFFKSLNYLKVDEQSQVLLA